MTDIVKATVDAGYPASTAKRGKVQGTKTWQLLLDEYLPDDLLAERHKELLNKREYRKKVDPTSKKETYEDIGPDTTAAVKALDMAYKLKGQYKEDKGEGKGNTAIYNLIYDPKLKEGVKTLEDSIKQALYNESNSKVVPMAQGQDGVYTTEQGGDNEDVGGDGGQDVSEGDGGRA